jgi:hypothetical protein
VALFYRGKAVFLGTYQEFVNSDHPEARRFLLKDTEEETQA